ncbi:MAG: VIT1/CCC1 transporter family protein [Planctomycetes bacterium]|nr:VIT1/CCC1 transporter family protein [Planctomycetota bacterium]
MSLVRSLDPATRLAELVFGLVMTLSFTLTASVLLREEGHAGARELMLAIFGCNLAWGVIDGGLFLLGQIVERGRKRRLWIALRNARDEREAEALLSDELDDLVGRGLEPAERASLYRSLGQKLRTLEPAPIRLTREDWRGALASCWLVFFTGIPAALPFFVLSDPFVALRTSNALLLLLLFFLGERSARSLGFPHPLRSGFTFLGFGALLVGVAIALGG